MYMEKILPRRMSTTACSFASHFGRKWLIRMQICAVKVTKISQVVTPPNLRPVLGHRTVLFPDSRFYGSHNFQIVPARLVILY